MVPNIPSAVYHTIPWAAPSDSIETTLGIPSTASVPVGQHKQTGDNTDHYKKYLCVMTYIHTITFEGS